MIDYLKRVILIPSAVYTSVLIGGGYGTGREIVEFFSGQGPHGGLIALATAFLVFVITVFLTFELARRGAHFDYRTFFKDLIGPAWWLFEALYLALMFLVLGVVASAASLMLTDEFGFDGTLGTVAILTAIALSVAIGRVALERVMSLCLLAMYALFIFYFASVWGSLKWIPISLGAGTADVVDSAWSGALYAFYNLAIIPVLLFAARDIHTPKEAGVSALAVSAAVLLPALLFHLSFTMSGSDVLEAPIPVYEMLSEYGSPTLVSAFVIVLLITLSQTGAGLLQGLVERVEGAGIFMEAGESELRFRYRAIFVVVVLGFSALLASLGVVALIGSGYSALAVGFGCVYVLPLLVLGIKRLL